MAEALGYTLEVRGVPQGEAAVVAGLLIEAGAASPAGRSFGYPLDGGYAYDPERRSAFFGALEQTDWSEAEGQVGELSTLHPEALFVLETRGHEEDCGRTYFRGGRSYGVTPELVYPEFDEARLPCA